MSSLSAAPQGHDYPKRETVDVALGRKWRCTPATAHERRLRELSPAQMVADELVEHIKRGNHTGIARVLAPIEAVLDRLTDGAPLADVLHTEERMDIAEDLAQEQHRHAPCAATARALVRASAAHRLAAQGREQGLKAAYAL